MGEKREEWGPPDLNKISIDVIVFLVMQLHTGFINCRREQEGGEEVRQAIVSATDLPPWDLS